MSDELEGLRDTPDGETPWSSGPPTGAPLSMESLQRLFNESAERARAPRDGVVVDPRFLSGIADAVALGEWLDDPAPPPPPSVVSVWSRVLGWRPWSRRRWGR